MNEHRYRWRNRQIREHLSVVDGKIAPTLWLKNGTYLNVFTKKWVTGHIWIYEDRIIYVGKDEPKNIDGTEIVSCEGKYLVPGYIEPHAHPFQLYNPHRLAQYASQSGTTTLINDNLMLLFLFEKKKAFSFLDDINDLPVSLYWWCRFDSQSALQDEESESFTDNANILSWLKHDAVVQGGELTNWPKILEGDDLALHWMQEAKRLRKPVEGHFPGASEKTLTKMKLLGTDGDHEGMTGKEVMNRIEMGYMTALRHSSIRPDLQKIIRELQELGCDSYDRMMLTTDGSPPSFYENGIINCCLEIVIQEGVPVEEAYCMASKNAAQYFGIDHRIGSLAPGHVAHINILDAKENPHPVSVLAKGKWMKRNGISCNDYMPFDWRSHGVLPLTLDWDLTKYDMQFSMPIGIEMMNDVILKPYPILANTGDDVLDSKNEAFLMLIDREGKWQVTTLLKGFTEELGGLASSFSNTGDITIIGKNKNDLIIAFNRMKEISGGIVLAQDGEIIFELPLSLGGMMSEEKIDDLIPSEKQLRELLVSKGYHFGDPIYTLLFLSSVHLPYIRITPKGIYDVKRKEVLFPSIMR
ncbi:adenine deaminase C-terminal domain-containing protein [Bacillaceae bacterium S4-13-56]